MAQARANRTLFSDFKSQFRQFFLFHFAPTLLYRNAYPRTRKAGRLSSSCCLAFQLVVACSLLASAAPKLSVSQLHLLARESRCHDLKLACIS